jgi:hypothetical protein
LDSPRQGYGGLGVFARWLNFLRLTVDMAVGYGSFQIMNASGIFRGFRRCQIIVTSPGLSSVFSVRSVSF